MTESVLVLIIEDEKRIASFLRKGLEAEGYRCLVAFDGEDGVRVALEEGPGLVILDLMLPKRDGFAVLREIRQTRPELPILILTAKGDLEDKLRGLDLGADDYITKPFAFEELVARIRARCRLRQQARSDRVEFAGLTLDHRERRLHHMGRKVDLSAKEYTLMDFFLRHPGQVLTRQQILNEVWGHQFDPQGNVVDVYVSYLRRKLRGITQAHLIETVRGVGYRVVRRDR